MAIIIKNKKGVSFYGFCVDFSTLACYYMNTVFGIVDNRGRESFGNLFPVAIPSILERSSTPCGTVRIVFMTPFNNSYVDELYEAILSLENKEDCRDFFEDLFTINEIISLSQRLSVAMKLDEGKTFSVITAETGASSATIGRVNKCLSYGTGGYRKIIDRLKETEASDE